MATKAYMRFIQRTETFAVDLELCSLLVGQFIAAKTSQRSIAEALGGDVKGHPCLGRRKDGQQSRSLCGAHLKHTLCEAFVKDLYEDFSDFVSDTVTRAAMKGIDPDRFAGEIDVDIRATRLLAAGSWEAVVKLVSDGIFRKLDGEHGTKALLKKADTLLGLRIAQKTLAAAMPYLEARHMFVHCNGKPNEQYRRDHPGIRLKDGKIVADDAFVAKARDAITALALEIDTRIIAAGLVRPQDLSGGH